MTDPILQVLRERFGLQAFRGQQRPVIEHVLAGGDALAIMPTGSGKSLLYQVPAQLLENPTVVLSPLIALMKDQVDALRRKGIEASFVNSSLSRAERHKRIQDFVSGRFRLLYVTPERFRSPQFLEAIGQVSVGLLAVDEAHCACEWGHDFRPDYSRIDRIRRLLGEPPTLALTATATPDVQREIRELLGIPGARLFHTGIERENLFLAASVSLHEEDKWQRVRALQQRVPGASIVYGALIKDLHRLEDYLPATGSRQLVYHGDLSREERRAMQEEFMSGPATHVLATSAFGMGIDKPDIRSILHHQVPGSVEAYYQEIGRAGRDGLPSYCELLYCEQDLPIQTDFIDWANPDRTMLEKTASLLQEWADRAARHDRDELQAALGLGRRRDGRVETCLQWLETLGVVVGSFERHNLRLTRPLDPEDIPRSLRPEKKERDLRRLLRMVEYVRTEGCRRVWLNQYFGIEAGPDRCHACDRCVDAEAWLREHLDSHEVAGGSVAASRAGFQAPRRGDFVRVDGRHLGRVRRVSGEGRRLRVEVELSSTLEVRHFVARRHHIEVLGGSG